MARLRRPKTLLALLIFVCWLDARNLGFLFIPQASGSYHYYETLGYSWVHFAVTTVTVALAATATGYLWYPRVGWFPVMTIVLGFLIASTSVSTWHMLPRLDVARTAFEAGRAGRGLPVPPDRLDAMFQPSTILYAAAASVIFFLVLWAAAWRHRDYVDPRYALDTDAGASAASIE